MSGSRMVVGVERFHACSALGYKDDGRGMIRARGATSYNMMVMRVL